jgi:hypothetical protein
VKCVGRFTNYDPEFHWYKDFPNGHADGRAQCATFLIAKPSSHAGYTIKVLFSKFSPFDDKEEDLPNPLAKSKVGRDFSFELPADFFTQKAVTIDDIYVKNFRMINLNPNQLKKSNKKRFLEFAIAFSESDSLRHRNGFNRSPRRFAESAYSRTRRPECCRRPTL